MRDQGQNQRAPADTIIVEKFVSHLSLHGHAGLILERRPDREIRNAQEIDAIAGSFAIEHTSIDTLPQQRQWTSQFSELFCKLEIELPCPLQFRLNLVIPYNAIPKRQTWRAVRGSVVRWIANEAARLDDGRHWLRVSPALTCAVEVIKASGGWPRLLVQPAALKDDTLPTRLRAQLDRKIKKLSKYRDLGKSTILLVDSADFANMSSDLLQHAICLAYPEGLPPGVDFVWYADSSIPGEVDFVDLTNKLR